MLAGQVSCCPEAPGLAFDVSLEFNETGFSTLRSFSEHLRIGKNRDMAVETILEIETLFDLTGGKDASATLVLKSGQLCLKVGDQLFQLLGPYSRKGNNLFVASYQGTQSKAINFKELLQQISEDVAAYIPPDLEVGLTDALLIYKNDDDNSKFLFELNLGMDINLAGLPLVGKNFPRGKSPSIEGFQILVVSSKSGFTKAEIESFNRQIPQSQSKLTVRELSRGISLYALVKFGDSSAALKLPLGGQDGSDEGQSHARPMVSKAAKGVAAADDPPPATTIKWIPIKKNIGPVYFERVGAQYRKSAIELLLDASLSAAGLTISLDGLSISTPFSFTNFSPKFNLHGLGIDYNGGGVVEIGGAFLRTIRTEGVTTFDEYAGSAMIKTKTTTIAGIGSYTELSGHPSLFVYACLDYPLGGPAFFFITGLAAGFGYNRKLIAPPLDKVAEFPLVQEAIKGTGDPNDLLGELGKLQEYIPPAIGEAFLAVGIKFNSFRLIDSFALLMIEFGSRVVFNMLGLSTAIIPTPEEGKSVTPLAEVQMAWKATFDPDEGFLGLSAQLTQNSYILSRDCHLTGGFAFYSWFSGEHAGDFVHTLGGYHPNFNVPAHYPSVPRLQFNWRVTGNLTLKGDAYYALTGSALMAGGHLAATWESGDLKAWFNAGADFLIVWKPYHYDASIYVDVGVSYTFNINLLFTSISVTISVDVGADLHIWGPDFSGHAHVHLWIISFGISFGADASQEPAPIDWSTFKASFLPADDAVCSLAVKDGLLKQIGHDKSSLGVINPKHFSLTTNSAIPFSILKINSTNDLAINRIYYIETEANIEYQPFSLTVSKELIQCHADKSKTLSSIGIGSMEVKANDFTSKYTIEITRQGDHVESDFIYTPILKRVPKGLWGETLMPELNEAQFIEHALTGFEITPKHQPEAGETAAIDRSKLQYSPDTIEEAYSWERGSSFVASAQDDKDRRSVINDTVEKSSVKKLRAELLQALGVAAEVGMSRTAGNAFLIPPQVRMPEVTRLQWEG